MQCGGGGGAAPVVEAVADKGPPKDEDEDMDFGIFYLPLRFFVPLKVQRAAGLSMLTESTPDLSFLCIPRTRIVCSIPCLVINVLCAMSVYSILFAP